MSVFMTIKKKLTTSQKDLTFGFKQLTIGTTKKRAASKKQEFAGYNLLNRYEMSWSDMHSLLRDSIKKNQVTDEKASYVAELYDKQCTALTEFYKELTNVPDVLASVETLVSQMHVLEEQLFAVEDLLLQLEDASENLSSVKVQHKETSLVEDYKFMRNFQCEERKVQMARHHMEDVQTFENNIQETLRERQRVFEDAYKEEIQHYKESGETGLKPTIQKEILEQVDVSFDDGSALENFLTDRSSNSTV